MIFGFNARIGLWLLCRLAAVMTGDAKKGSRIVAQYGAPIDSVYGYEDWDAVGKNDGVDIVYIVSTASSRQQCVLRS